MKNDREKGRKEGILKILSLPSLSLSPSYYLEEGDGGLLWIPLLSQSILSQFLAGWTSSQGRSLSLSLSPLLLWRSCSLSLGQEGRTGRTMFSHLVRRQWKGWRKRRFDGVGA